MAWHNGIVHYQTKSFWRTKFWRRGRDKNPKSIIITPRRLLWAPVSRELKIKFKFIISLQIWDRQVWNANYECNNSWRRYNIAKILF